MPITYPLTLPNVKDFSSVSMTLAFNQGQHISPITKTEQILGRLGSYWTMEASLPPMKGADAAEWRGFFGALRGRVGTFELAPPDYTRRGAAAANGAVNGATQSGISLVTDGWALSVTGLLKRGDFFQAENQLYMITQDVNSDAGGNATLDFVPEIRTPPADNAVVEILAPKALMRLSEPAMGWAVDPNKLYSMRMSAEEVRE